MKTLSIFSLCLFLYAYDGIKTVVDGVKNANNATTDAEAKDAWEQIGNGAFETGVGVYVAYKSGELLVNELPIGFENIVNENSEILNSEDWFQQISKDSILDPENLVDN